MHRLLSLGLQSQSNNRSVRLGTSVAITSACSLNQPVAYGDGRKGVFLSPSPHVRWLMVRASCYFSQAQHGFHWFTGWVNSLVSSSGSSDGLCGLMERVNWIIVTPPSTSMALGIVLYIYCLINQWTSAVMGSMMRHRLLSVSEVHLEWPEL